MLKGLMQHKPVKCIINNKEQLKPAGTKIDTISINYTDSNIPQIKLTATDIGLKTLSSTLLNMSLTNGGKYKIVYSADGVNKEELATMSDNCLWFEELDSNTDSIICIKITLPSSTSVNLQVYRNPYEELIIKQILKYEIKDAGTIKLCNRNSYTNNLIQKHSIMPSEIVNLVPSITNGEPVKVGNMWFKYIHDGYFDGYYYASSDNKTWTQLSIRNRFSSGTQTVSPSDIQYMGGLYLVYTYYESQSPQYTLMYSRDGINWQNTPVTCDGKLGLVYCHNGKFAIYNYYPSSRESLGILDINSLSVTYPSTLSSSTMHNFYYYNNKLYMTKATGTSANIYYSTDLGKTWTSCLSVSRTKANTTGPNTAQLYFANNTFIAHIHNAKVSTYYSTDGITFTEVSKFTYSGTIDSYDDCHYLREVRFNKGIWLIEDMYSSSKYYYYYCSQDGITWIYITGSGNIFLDRAKYQINIYYIKNAWLIGDGYEFDGWGNGAVYRTTDITQEITKDNYVMGRYGDFSNIRCALINDIVFIGSKTHFRGPIKYSLDNGLTWNTFINTNCYFGGFHKQGNTYYIVQSTSPNSDATYTYHKIDAENNLLYSEALK